jgi:hypothetical protein
MTGPVLPAPPYGIFYHTLAIQGNPPAAHEVVFRDHRPPLSASAVALSTGKAGAAAVWQE